MHAAASIIYLQKQGMIIHMYIMFLILSNGYQSLSDPLGILDLLSHHTFEDLLVLPDVPGKFHGRSPSLPDMTVFSPCILSPDLQFPGRYPIYLGHQLIAVQSWILFDLLIIMTIESGLVHVLRFHGQSPTESSLPSSPFSPA